MTSSRTIIDLHAHWFSPRSTELLAARTAAPRIAVENGGRSLLTERGGAITGPFALGDQWFDIAARLDHLDELSIEHQLISWPTTLGIDAAVGAEVTLPIWEAYNEDLSALVAEHPRRLSGVAVLSTSDIAWSVRELQRAHEELGLVGAVLPVNGFASLAAAEQFAPVFEVAQHYGSHIYLHTGYANPAVPGQPPVVAHADSALIRGTLDTSSHFANAVITLAFTSFLDAYPDVNVQVAMLGGSGLIALVAEQVAISAERLGTFDLKERFHRIFLDTGAAGRGSQAIGLATKVFGAEQIVFGSDYGPFPSIAPIIENIEASPIDDADRKLIYEDNARRVLSRLVPVLAAP